MQYLPKHLFHLFSKRQVPTYQIAWSCSFTSFAFERCAMNPWTRFNSQSSPASKPRESWNIKPGLVSNIIALWISCSPRYSVEDVNSCEHASSDCEPFTFKDGSRVDGSIWYNGNTCEYLTWTWTIYFTFLPSGSKITGSFVELQRFRKIVVLPALARPMTRIRKLLNLPLNLSISRALSWGLDEVLDIAKDSRTIRC